MVDARTNTERPINAEPVKETADVALDVQTPKASIAGATTISKPKVRLGYLIGYMATILAGSFHFG